MTRLYVSWFDVMFDEVRYIHDWNLRHQFVGQFFSPEPNIMMFSSARVER